MRFGDIGDNPRKIEVVPETPAVRPAPKPTPAPAPMPQKEPIREPVPA
jgi:hypothetical protein